jgi:hypothetical protein
MLSIENKSVLILGMPEAHNYSWLASKEAPDGLLTESPKVSTPE